MFNVAKIREKLKLEPGYFSMKVDEGLLLVARTKLEQTISRDLGLILTVVSAKATSDGFVIHGDPAAYYTADLEVLTYKPEVNEVIEGEVVELMDFGAFINMGPLDGLVHLSQITDDFMSFNRRAGAITAKTKNRSLKKGDIVCAKVATVSMKKTVNDSKIGLTMKGPGLGKEEWLLQKKDEPKESQGSKPKKTSKKGDSK